MVMLKEVDGGGTDGILLLLLLLHSCIFSIDNINIKIPLCIYVVYIQRMLNERMMVDWHSKLIENVLKSDVPCL